MVFGGPETQPQHGELFSHRMTFLFGRGKNPNSQPKFLFVNSDFFCQKKKCHTVLKQCRKRPRGSSVNQTPPPPLVHERRPRGSRRCTELELSVVVVHGSSRNSITERAWFMKPGRCGVSRTAPPAVRFGVQQPKSQPSSIGG